MTVPKGEFVANYLASTGRYLAPDARIVYPEEK